VWWLGSDSASQPFVVSSAATLPAVTRATSLIVDTLAGLPWDVSRGRETLITPDWLDDPQATRYDGRIHAAVQPGRLTRVEFWAQVIQSTLWYGNGFVAITERNLDGTPKAGAMHVIHPDLVEYVPGHGYFIKDPDSTEWIPIPDGQLLHFRGLGELDERKFAMGVLERHAQSLRVAYEVRNYTTGTFQSGVPNGYIKVTNPNITEDQANAIKSKWLENHGNKRSIAVLNASTEFTPLSISPVDAQLVEVGKWSMVDVALAFGVDPYMLGAPTDGNTYANVESRMLSFIQNTLLPWARRIEATLSAELPRGTWLKVDFNGLLRADTATRFNAYSTAISDGWMLIDEVRALEDLAPLPNTTPSPEVMPNV
jgi:HK97 family phage portal protein